MSNFVIVDLEMCTVPPKEKERTQRLKNEMIQIGAVLLDDSFEIADSFVTYVKPQYGSISKKIENLTGISSENVENAPVAKEALESFAKWLPDDVILVSWSQSDEAQIRKECMHKAIHIEKIENLLESWVDCQKTFSDKRKSNRPYKLSEALIIADLDYDDGEHDALVDARNTAKLFAKMQKELDFKMCVHFSEEKTHVTMYNPFADVLAGYYSL